MSRGLAKRLMEAESAEAFLSARPSGAGWRAFASLKLEVDSSVHIDLDAARSLVERIEQAAALTGDSTSVSFAQASRATLLNALGNHSEANQLYESSAQVLRSAKLHTHAAILQKQQVYVLTHMGRYDEALRVARSARRVLAHGNRIELAQLETNIGTIYYRLDRYKKALAHYERGRNMLPRHGTRSMRAFIDGNRSNVFLETDQPVKAMRLLEGTVATCERAGQTLAAAQARSKIAYIEFLRGNYNTALAGYYPVLEQIEALGSGRLVAWCNLEIAEILLALNSFSDAIESAEAARSRFSEMEMPYESAQASVVMALAEMGLKQLDAANSTLVDARRVFEQNENVTFVALIDSYLAELALQRGDEVEAARRAESALRVFSRQKLSTRVANARRIAAWASYAAGDLNRASRLARAALRTVEDVFLPGVAYQCHHLIGKIARDRGRRREALESFRRAVQTVERMRGGIVADEFKASFLRDKIDVYEDAIAACLDEGGKAQVEEAFRLVESSKSRALADLVARYLRDTPVTKPRRGAEGIEADTRARLLKLIEELNWYNSQAGLEDDKGGQRRAHVAERYRQKVLRCERQIAQLFRRLEAAGSAFAEMHRTQAATATQLRTALDPDEAAIEYFTTGDDISAFVVTRERVEVARRIASKSAVEQTLSGLRFQIEKFNYGPGYADEYFEQLNGATNQYLTRLYLDLFAGLEPLVADRKRLIVVPHGPLHNVPFHALVNRNGYLIDQFEMSYAPSATVLRLCRQRAKQSQISNGRSKISPRAGRLVAMGLAHHDTPNIAGEIEALAQIFPNTVALTGMRATRDNLMREAPRARFLHLASHGYFRGDNPMFSFLKLADSNLNFYSLLDLKLNAELVTLSACHTGVNKVFPGDELHGLMRGFLHAGAPSLVASLWATSDASTAELMKEMYQQIHSGASKRAALRAAQLAVKDAYGHPYYWAPFVLMGNPN